MSSNEYKALGGDANDEDEEELAPIAPTTTTSPTTSPLAAVTCTVMQQQQQPPPVAMPVVLTQEQQQQMLLMLLASNNGRLPTLLTTTTPLPPPPNTSRVETNETCPKDHKLVLNDYMTAIQFISSHHPGSNLGGKGGIACKSCLFSLQLGERVFLCEVCTLNPSTGATTYCETCVSTGLHQTGGNGQWSSGLLDCAEDPKSCVDTALCYPCKMASLDTWAMPREDGKVPGEGKRCSACLDIAVFTLHEVIALGTLSAIHACMTSNTAARIHSIETPGDCSGFCTAYWCRCCVITRVHRQWQTRADELGQPTGCLFNFKGQPARKKLPRVSYTKNVVPHQLPVPPHQMQAMGDQMPTTTGSLPTKAVPMPGQL